MALDRRVQSGEWCQSGIPTIGVSTELVFQATIWGPGFVKVSDDLFLLESVSLPGKDVRVIQPKSLPGTLCEQYHSVSWHHITTKTRNQFVLVRCFPVYVVMSALLVRHKRHCQSYTVHLVAVVPKQDVCRDFPWVRPLRRVPSYLCQTVRVLRSSISYCVAWRVLRSWVQTDWIHCKDTGCNSKNRVFLNIIYFVQLAVFMVQSFLKFKPCCPNEALYSIMFHISMIFFSIFCHHFIPNSPFFEQWW